MDNFFIDKLNITQDHNLETGALPVYGREKLYRVDLKTGVTTELVTHEQLEGSYSSSLTIRCNGGRVEVYGNPSRWGRIDNLYGLKTLDECVAVYNHVLQSIGLPPFTKCTKYLYFQNKGSDKFNKTADGAIIKHIDFTRNLSVGQGNERPFLKALSTQSINRSISPYLFPDQNTVEWYGANAQKKGSTYRYVKVYCKTSDLLRNQKKLCKGVSDDDLDYFEQLLQFTVTRGVVREEHSFKREYLHRHCLFAYGLVDETLFHEELQVITKIRNRLEVSHDRYETIADKLLAEGVVKTRQAANATMSHYYNWVHGVYMDQRNSNFRVHKSRLLQLGIDISQKLDITRATPLHLRSSTVIDVSYINPPDWYRLPVVPDAPASLKPKLSLVA